MSLLSVLKRKVKTHLFTTPSHSGKFFIHHKFYQFYKNDISETDTHNPLEALNKAESKAAQIYGTKTTKFLTNGSTSGIIAAVLTCVNKGKKVLIWNKSHPCHKNAVELANGDIIEYELPYLEDWGIYGELSKDLLENYLKDNNIKAIIVTSPSYEGITSDIKSLKEVCQKHNTYLIVDEAHGALYPFNDKLPKSAVNIADFTVQSLHKTAGGLNPTALLHTMTNLDISKSLAKINTTSPSYPLLATIEANINYLNSKKGRKNINKLIDKIEKIKNNIKNIEFYNGDITKILIKKSNISGFELSEKLYNLGIEDEKANSKSVLLLTGLGTDDKKLDYLAKKLTKI